MSLYKGIVRKVPKTRLSDPYLSTKSLPEPTICPTCNLLYHNKRWARNDELVNAVTLIAYKYKCPSCRKIGDRYPMGIVTVWGDFFVRHKSDIINLIKNTERREIQRNQLDRIMSLKDTSEKVVIETTSENLAIAIGKALKKAYKGMLEIKFSENNKLVRVNWQRE